MNFKVAAIAILAIFAGGCTAPSTMDRLKQAEAKKESRIRESDEVKRLKEENLQLRNQSIKQLETSSAATVSRQTASAPRAQSPNVVGYVQYNEPYSDERLKKMALELATSFAINEQREYTEEVPDPGYEMTEGLSGTRNRDYSKYKYNRDRTKVVRKGDNGRTSLSDVTLNLNEKDRLMWARVEVHFGPERHPYSLFYYFSQGKNSEGGFFWTPYNTKGMNE